MSASAATREFLMRFAALLSDKARTDPALSSFAKATAGLESETDQESSLDLSTHPITAHVAPLLDRATADADLVDTIRALTGDLRWYQIFQVAVSTGAWPKACSPRRWPAPPVLSPQIRFAPVCSCWPRISATPCTAMPPRNCISACPAN